MLTIKLRLPFSPCVQCAWIAGAQSFVYLWQSFERFIQPPSVRREGVVWHPALRLTCHACRINSRGPLTSRTPPCSLSVWTGTYYLSQQVDHSVWVHNSIQIFYSNKTDICGYPHHKTLSFSYKQDGFPCVGQGYHAAVHVAGAGWESAGHVHLDRRLRTGNASQDQDSWLWAESTVRYAWRHAVNY